MGARRFSLAARRGRANGWGRGFSAQLPVAAAFMLLQRLDIKNFRLIGSASIGLGPGISAFVGANAQGKTTILEAVSYLATGRSFRTQRDRECLSRRGPGEEIEPAIIEAIIATRAAERRIRVALEPSRKQVWVDGKLLRGLSQLWGITRAVFFIPSDLALIQGAPAERRSLLDTLGAQLDPAYLQTLGAYRTALTNRNALLREGRAARAAQLDAFEAGMAESAARVLLSRAELVRALSPLVAGAVEELGGGEEHARLSYEPGIGREAASRVSGDDPPTPATLARQLAAFWRENRPADMDRRTTLRGPHRDDVATHIDGADARTYASQGQTRGLVLALRLAELDLLARRGGDAPLLLLDDVLGELDQRRAGRFLDLVAARGVQTLLTATDAAGIEGHVPIAARFTISAGCAISSS